MYAADTILKLKEQREPDPETGEEFPYNLVKVVAPDVVSPRADHAEKYGVNAKGVIIEPLSNFGGVVSYPYGFLLNMYDVESEPVVNEQDVQQKVRIVESNRASAGPTPEEIFAQTDTSTAPVDGHRRARTPFDGSEDASKLPKGPLD